MVKYILKLNIGLISLIFVSLLSFTSEARDIFYINSTQTAKNNFSQTDIGVSLPPIGSPQLMWMNSLSRQYASDSVLEFSQFKWSPSFMRKINEDSTLIAALPFNFSSTGSTPEVSENSVLSSAFLTVANKPTGEWNWGYGLLILDLQYKTKAYPLVSFSYASLDGLWKAGIGYPLMGVAYYGLPETELSLFASRESSKFYITEKNKFSPDARYIEQNLNTVGLGVKYNLTRVLKLNVKIGYSFASQYQFLDSSYTKISEYADYSKQTVASLGLSVDFSGLRKQ